MSAIQKNRLAFTLCSNNYLAQAKVLGDSLLQNNPNYHFIIGLVDEVSDAVDYTGYGHFDIIPISQLSNIDLEPLWRKYNIIELNTCVKATFIKHLRIMYPSAMCIFYFDPDVKIYDSLAILEAELEVHDILLTPHILSPLPLDCQLPAESTFLNYGLYNLGFLGLKPFSSIVDSMLDWWEARILQFGYDRIAEGYFVDQIWANLVPLFFENVKILKSLGCNMAPWNLHERRGLAKTGAIYEMPDRTRLMFYHFSGYNVAYPQQISKYFNRFPLSTMPVLEEMYKQYHDELLANKIDALSLIPCVYVTKYKEYANLTMPQPSPLEHATPCAGYSPIQLVRIGGVTLGACCHIARAIRSKLRELLTRLS